MNRKLEDRTQEHPRTRSIRSSHENRHYEHVTDEKSNACIELPGGPGAPRVPGRLEIVERGVWVYWMQGKERRENARR